MFRLLEKGEFDKIKKKYNPHAIEYKFVRDYEKGVAYSILAFLYRDTDLKKFREMKRKAFKNLKNNLLYYYVFYRAAMTVEDYSTARDYLMYVYSLDPFLGGNEEILHLGYVGGKKAMNNKNYRDAWLLSADGARVVNELDYNRHIKERLGVKSTLLLSSRMLVNELKTNTQKIYIIDETSRLIEADKKKENTQDENATTRS